MRRASLLCLAAWALTPGLAAAAPPWSEEAVFTPPTADAPLFAEALDLSTSTLVTESPRGTLLLYTRSEGAWSGPEALVFPISEWSDGFATSGDDLVTLLEITEDWSTLFTAFEGGGLWSPPEETVDLGGVADGEGYAGFAAGDTWLYVTTYRYAGLCVHAPVLRAFRRDGRFWIADGEVRLASCPAGPREVTALVVDGDRVAFTLGPSEGGAGGPEPAALVYRAGASSSWFEEGTFAADDPAGSSYTALALAGDWLALASAAAADGRGVVDLYAFDGATWSLRQQLTGAQTQTFTGEALALDSNLLAATAIRDGQPVVELYRNDGEWRHEQTVALAAASLDLKGPRLAVGVASPQALHVYGRGGDLPTGVCVDDSDCSGSCVDGVCAPPDTTDEGDPEDADGCGCRSDAAPSPIASLLLLALVIAGSRRRPA